MKKLIFTLAVIAFAAVSYGQSYINELSVTTDTVTDTGTKYGTFIKLTKPYDYVLFASADKVSGTVSGSVKLEVSPDGTNWITHPTADTLTYTNVSDGVAGLWTGTDLPYTYIRANVTGTGSSVSVWTFKLILKD